MQFSPLAVGVAGVLLLAGAAGAQPAASPTTRFAVTPPSPAVSIGTATRDWSATDLDSLVARALAANPALRAAAARIEAAEHRIAPAGARPDPMLMAGLRDFPVSRPGFRDDFTMKMVGVSQTMPYPGKVGLARQAAEHDADAARAELAGVRLDITRQVKAAYYELAFLDRALEVVDRNRALLTQVVRVAEAHYGVGSSALGGSSVGGATMGATSGAPGMEEVLVARVEATRLGDDASGLIERRRATVAELNALLDRPSETALPNASVPAGIVRAAIPDSASRIRFTSEALGARAADSPLRPLAELQDAAVANSPMLHMHEARIAAQAARVELARKASRPDFDVSVEYGQRDRLPDMVTAQVSIPLRLQKARKQDEELAATRADLAALEAEHHTQVNALRAEVAQRYADAERARTQLALYARAVLPQARAAVAVATANYQAGRTPLRATLDAQATLFNYDTAYYRALSDFATSVAALEQTIGQEILP